MEEELLEKLEVLQQGRASSEQEADWATFVQQTPNAQQIATEYERIWDGFIALRGTQFLSQIQIWDQEWQALDDDELAEWFINGQLHPDNAKVIEQRISSDSAFAQVVNQQKQLKTGFSALKNDQLRDWMQEWETEQDTPPTKVVPMRRSWLRPLAIAASILLLLFAASTIFVGQRYDDEPLAQGYYQLPTTGNTMGASEELNDYLQAFSIAHQALQANDYTRAARLFSQLSTLPPPLDLGDDLTYYQENIEWNLLLARLGASDLSSDFATRLGLIADNPDHTYHTQAQHLRQDLASFWRLF